MPFLQRRTAFTTDKCVLNDVMGVLKAQPMTHAARRKRKVASVEVKILELMSDFIVKSLINSESRCAYTRTTITMHNYPKKLSKNPSTNLQN
ncbi:hypothetical protein Y032_0137g2031 [Ancylostoma ceylanicum]|uniref:Uncharacterized protein n=1 Tax=Ancylostoma ceylanicum TaxID=53326 RepID=A0A016T586_9BILA|nr:hypothetical protein Y032_0137g2031 [Ancylostoma ceylanicum]